MIIKQKKADSGIPITDSIRSQTALTKSLARGRGLDSIIPAPLLHHFLRVADREALAGGTADAGDAPTPVDADQRNPENTMVRSDIQFQVELTAGSGS
jgi:hypothetical protein